MSRVRREPTRRCIVCSVRRSKSDLQRIVRTSEGRVVFDSTGRMNGRGAYVCGDAHHSDEGVDHGKLIQALRVEINEPMSKLLDEAKNKLKLDNLI